LLSRKGLDSASAAAYGFGPLVESEPMLTVRDIAAMPGLGLAVVAGSDGLDNPVS
jgi:hypothetical protein